MTAVEMKLRFNVGLNSEFNYSAPPFEPVEIYTFLTAAQNEYLNDRLPSSRNTRESLNETERSKLIYSVLVRASNLSSTNLAADQNYVYPYAQRYDLPSDYWYPLPSYCDVTITSGNSLNCYDSNLKTNVNVLPVTEDYYNGNIHNPHKCPNEDVVWRLTYKRTDETSEPSSTNRERHELVRGNTYTVTTYHLRYLRKPKPIIYYVSGSIDYSIEGYLASTVLQMNCELDSWCHQDIVNIAVKNAAKSIRDTQRWQIENVEERTNV